ncbi:MAG: serine--tRNA ligase [Peptococcaceae bacterium]|jgi:seryl-tRNA synthetase|nr:serine--tRNA ligase [Peptococcaceae bacterium]
MLDLKFLRQNAAQVQAALARRGLDITLDEFLQLDEKRRRLLFEAEQMKNRLNTVSLEIGRLKKAGRDAGDLQSRMRELSQEIKEMDEQVRAVVDAQTGIQLSLPNLPDESVPLGTGAEDNLTVRAWGAIPSFPFPPKPHWELGEDLGIIDFERGAKVSGARFSFARGLGARLERALINFMLDLHVSRGYTEVFPPFLVNRESMTGTGQLPKFAGEMFRVEDAGYYLIPTAEVPVTNLYRGEVLDGARLPVKLAAYSACFRAEAGAAGKDTRGLIRQHQFNKVELVKFCRPEDSFEELETLTADACRVLESLGLPYRVVVLCTGDMGFASAKTYDLEVWLPAAGTYREISSCSNFGDFQARRANIRYRDGRGKSAYVHTLNGSGVAVGRTVAAILENYQQADGSVVVPEALRPFMRVDRIEKS